MRLASSMSDDRPMNLYNAVCSCWLR
ncbi:MAG: hypothetical protein GXZ15_04550 [Campylobacter sp.]|nr:hypothetical protein [Campylobacter sp.]